MGMYLHRTNKWKEFLLLEAVEDIGLPPKVARLLRQQNETYGPVENKHLTWIGQLVKSAGSHYLLPRDNLQEIERHLLHSIRVTLEKRASADPGRRFEIIEGYDELWADAKAPLIEFGDELPPDGPSIDLIKKFKKRFMKYLRRLEIEPKFLKGFNSYVDNRMEIGAQHLSKYIKPIVELLSEDPGAYNDIRDVDPLPGLGASSRLRAAAEQAQDLLDNPPKNPDQVIHEFDNGYFWYDIQSHACKFEAQKMGHCGRGEDGVLYSLRTGEKRRVKPMVTLEFDDGIIYQVKGKGNTAPKKDLWPYISWFIENMDVRRIQEAGQHASDSAGFEEMLEYLQEKHPDLESGSNWIKLATEVLEMGENSISEDSQTSLEIEWPGGDEHIGVAGVVLRHQAYWPIKDIIVDEDTHRLRWEIRHDAQSIADDTLYPNPRIRYVEVFARGVQDSEAAMLRVDMVWDEDFQPNDDEEETVKSELDRLDSYLIEIAEISSYLVSDEAAPEEAKFDYNAFHEGIQKKLEAYGVYRDLAGEIDAEKERARSDQLGLPGIDAPRVMTPEEKAEEEHYLDQIYATTVPAVRREYQRRLDALRRSLALPLQEQRIIQRWQQIIK